MDTIAEDHDEDAIGAEELAEVTEQQLAILHELGVAEADCRGLGFAEAEAWIEQLEAVRERAGRTGRE